MLEQIKKDLKSRLSEHRYKHTESVVATALDYAGIFGIEETKKEKIELAGWLHDCCKELKNVELATLAKFYGIKIYDEDKAHPNILHARVGAIWAEEEYEILDPYITQAIRDHTLGSAKMLESSKILFLADMLEPGRGDNEELERLRNLVKETDLDKALLEAMNSKITYVLKKNHPIHPLSLEARNAMLESLT